MSSSLKIIQIIDTLELGGAERVLVTLSNILHSKGHTVKVLTILHNGPLQSQLLPGIEVECLCRKNKWNIATMYRLTQSCKGFDVVHVHSSFNLRYVFIAFKLFFVNKKIFFHEHFGNIEIDNSVSWHQRLIYPQTFFIAVSRKIHEWALHNLKMDKAKVLLLPNTVLKPSLEKIQKTKTEKIELLLTSNFRSPKNIEFAVDLMNVFSKQKACHLTIVGQTADAEYCNSIKTKIKALHLEEIISLVHDCDNIQTILSQFDLAIHTAKTESGPLVLIEYLSAGLPFLTYETGEVVYQIKDALSECIINNFDIDNWISQINNLIQLNADELSSRLKSIYQQLYSAEAYYQSLMNIYQLK
jgi:glycosyltransferase involved in cell wall biosynthesis